MIRTESTRWEMTQFGELSLGDIVFYHDMLYSVLNMENDKYKLWYQVIFAGVEIVETLGESILFTPLQIPLLATRPIHWDDEVWKWIPDAHTE